MKFSGKLLAAHLSVLAANIIYGVNYAVAKEIMPEPMHPRAIIFVRALGSFILFLIFYFAFIRERIDKKDILKLFICSVFGIAINQIMFFEGLNLTTSINSSIIMTITPILVLLFSSFLLKEKITLLKITGIISGTAGAIILILQNGELSFSSGTFAGDIMIIINASSFAVYLVIVKPLLLKYHPVTVLTAVFGFGFLLVLPFTINPFIDANFEILSSRNWISLSFIVVFATFLGYLFYNLAIRKLSPTATSTYIYLQPIFAGIVAYFMLSEKPGIAQLIAIILIVFGVTLVSYKTTNKAEKK